MKRQFSVAALLLMAPLVLGAAGTGHPPTAPSGQGSAAEFPDNTIFFVDDLQVVDNAAYPKFVRIALSPPPSPPTGPNPVYHTYFEIKADRLKGSPADVAVAQAWIAMLVAKLRDCKVGVEPKVAPHDSTVTGDVDHPYELIGLSYGSLDGTSGQGECRGKGTRADPHLGLFYGQTPPG